MRPVRRVVELGSLGDSTRMKTGPLLGWLGCMLWMLNFAAAPKIEWVSLSVVITAVALLIIGTIITGMQKQRTRLGIGLSLLAVVFGIGFLIMMIIPEKESRDVA